MSALRTATACHLPHNTTLPTAHCTLLHNTARLKAAGGQVAPPARLSLPAASSHSCRAAHYSLPSAHLTLGRRLRKYGVATRGRHCVAACNLQAALQALLSMVRTLASNINNGNAHGRAGPYAHTGNHWLPARRLLLPAAVAAMPLACPLRDTTRFPH